MDYKPLYYGLFNAITMADTALEHSDIFRARLILQRAQKDAESHFLALCPTEHLENEKEGSLQ